MKEPKIQLVGAKTALVLSFYLLLFWTYPGPVILVDLSPSQRATLESEKKSCHAFQCECPFTH